jgi:hypothetical protein
MASLAAEWQKVRTVLEYQKYEWHHVILPRNMLDDAFKDRVNNMFLDLEQYLDNDESLTTAEALWNIQLDQNELSNNLVLACVMSGFEVRCYVVR